MNNDTRSIQFHHYLPTPISPSGDGIFFYDILHIDLHRDNIYLLIHKLLLVINLPHFGHSLLISPNIGLPQDIEGLDRCS